MARSDSTVLLEELYRFAQHIGPVAERAYFAAARNLTQGVVVDGETQGELSGVAKGKADLLIRQFTLRFGVLSEANREKVLSASSERLNVLAERILVGSSVDEILR